MQISASCKRPLLGFLSESSQRRENSQPPVFLICTFCDNIDIRKGGMRYTIPQTCWTFNFEKNTLLQEVYIVTNELLNLTATSDIFIDYRVKSVDSINKKYTKYYPDRQAEKVFNDLIGFRGLCNDYSEVLSNLVDPRFRIVNMFQGKANDDGYRGVHLYFQIDHFHYPVEIQYNTYYDRQFNDWAHIYFYKKNISNAIGRMLRNMYDHGMIHTKKDFKEALYNVLYCGDESK